MGKCEKVFLGGEKNFSEIGGVECAEKKRRRLAAGGVAAGARAAAGAPEKILVLGQCASASDVTIAGSQFIVVAVGPVCVVGIQIDANSIANFEFKFGRIVV